MGNKTHTSLREGHIYRLGDLLLEATCCDLWTLNLLTDAGDYIPVEHGALIAYELRVDGLWHTVHHSFESLLPGGELWTVFYGDTMQIDLAQLVFVAEHRSQVQRLLAEQEHEFLFRELMSAMDW